LIHRTASSALSILAAVVLSSGCDRCGGSKETNTPAAPDGASAAAPVVVAPDGGRVRPGIPVTELQAVKVGGPLSPGKMRAASGLSVDCHHEGMSVSPTIFGVAFADEEADMGATAHRWGGNTTSRYNPRLERAWSTGNDWFWENVQIDSVQTFLAKAAEKGGRAAVTVPIMGWVAKDQTSCAFPVSVFGPQEKTDPHRPDCGNGKKPDGKTLVKPGEPTRTAVPLTPQDVTAWVKRLKEEDQKRGRRVVYEYILDNEPALWDSTHRDVHPDPTTYDELLEKTIAYGTAVRLGDPDAIIAGPAEWGWPGYFFSAKDAKAGFQLKPDRRAHGDQPLLAWYLKKLAEHEKKSGIKILDVLDVHIYPQGENVQGPDGQGGDGGGGTDRSTNDLRFRTTRSLWDRDYKDESWIQDAVYLIPRMKELIANNYPGLGFQIGEYNFGAEHHIAGGVALAEALGRFALHGVSHAYYWTRPKKPQPAYWAFRAYRNYDGNGGHFLDRIVPTSSPTNFSLYASRDLAGKKWVLVALNFSQDKPENASIALDGCTPPSTIKSFVYTGGDAGFTAGDAKLDSGYLKVTLPKTSITVIEMSMP
jgi:hypothetical protein